MNQWSWAKCAFKWYFENNKIFEESIYAYGAYELNLEGESCDNEDYWIALAWIRKPYLNIH